MKKAFSAAAAINILRQNLSLPQLKEIQASLVEAGLLDENVFVANLVLKAYANCQAPAQGFQIFLGLSRRNVFSWNIALACSGDVDHAISVFQRMPHHNAVSCSQTMTMLGGRCVEQAMALFTSMPYKDVVCWNAMINIASGGLLQDVFSKLPHHGIVSCNAMIHDSSAQGAMIAFFGMVDRDEGSWNLVIAASAKTGELEAGECILSKMPAWSMIAWNTMIHACVAQLNYHRALNLFERMPVMDELSCSAMITAFSMTGQIDQACVLFSASPSRSLVSWSAMAVAMFRTGEVDIGWKVMVSMPLWTISSWNGALQASAAINLAGTKELFDEILPGRDLVSWNTMLLAACNHKCNDDLWEVFERAPERDIVSWNTILQALPSIDDKMPVFASMPQRDVISWTILTHASPSRFLFERMPQRSAVSWTAMIQVLAERTDFIGAKICFQQMPQHTLVSWNALIQAASASGRINESRLLLERMPQRNQASWMAAMAACSWDRLEDAKHLLALMPEKDCQSWNAMLAVTARREAGSSTSGRETRSNYGHIKELFDRMPRHSPFACNVMMAGSVEAGFLDEASTLFEQMPDRDGVSWNIVIGALVDGDRAREAMDMFRRMDMEGVAADQMSFGAALNACSSLSDSKLGRLIQREVTSRGLEEQHAEIGTALLRMMSCCGARDTAAELFNRLRRYHPTPALWTAMISANPCPASLRLGNAMALDGIDADGIAFSALLSCCAHAGLVDQGAQLLRSMSGDFDVEPEWNHYMFVVDLLGRAGRVEEAKVMMDLMPNEASERGWVSLLAACNKVGDLEEGFCAARFAMDRSASSSGTYVLLFNTMLQTTS